MEIKRSKNVVLLKVIGFIGAFVGCAGMVYVGWEFIFLVLAGMIIYISQILREDA